MRICLGSSISVILAASVVSFGCGKSKSDDAGQGHSKPTAVPTAPGPAGSLVVSLTGDAIGAMPTIKTAGQPNPAISQGTLDVGGGTMLRDFVEGLGLLPTPTPVPGYAVNSSIVQDLFAFQCWWFGRPTHYNLCPSGIKTELGPVMSAGGSTMGDAPYTYSSSSVIGMIASAHEHIANVYSEFRDPAEFRLRANETEGNLGRMSLSSSGTVIPDGHPQFASATGVNGVPATNTEPTKFIVGTPNLYDYWFLQSGSGTEQRTSIYHKNGRSEGRYAYLTYRKNQTLENQLMNDIHEQVITMKDDKTTTHFMAFSSTNFNSTISGGSRNFLLINFEKSTFMLKLAWRDGVNNTDVVAAGRGGFDFKTGLWRDGAYMVRSVENGGTPWFACVDNKTQTVTSTDVASASDCVDVRDWFQGGTFSAADFLEMTTTERTDLAAFMAFFADDDALPASAVPSGSDDIKNIPDSVQ